MLDEFQSFLEGRAKLGLGSCVMIDHEPAPKANSRRIFTRKTRGKSRPISIKSEKALSFVAVAEASPVSFGPKKLIVGDVFFVTLCRYGSRRPDLDESLVMDSMQGKLYDNDRQIKAKLILGAVDKARPSAFVYCEPMESGLIPVTEGLGRIVKETKERSGELVFR